MEEEYKYGGVYCTSYIPWVFLFPISAITFYEINVYISGLTIIATSIVVALLVRCRINCPENIAEISDNIIIINIPEESKSIDIDSISSLELKSNKIVVHLTNNQIINIPGGYWKTTHDMRGFISAVNKIKPNNTFERDAIKNRYP